MCIVSVCGGGQGSDPLLAVPRSSMIASSLLTAGAQAGAGSGGGQHNAGSDGVGRGSPRVVSSQGQGQAGRESEP